MSYEKVAKIVNMLCARTKEGKIKWEQTEKKEVYQSAFSNYSVRLFSRPSAEGPFGGDDIYLQIINSNGSIVEEVSDPDLQRHISGSHEKMSDLFQTARRQALGVEEALDDIIQDLDDLDIPF